MNATRGLTFAVLFLVIGSDAWSQELPPYLRDRGPGIPTSMFGTYITKGELLIYPFFEYYRDKDFEYKPEEFGFGFDEDFRGKYRASEGLIFIAYGVSDRLAVEFEAAVISARLEKAPDDPSAMPDVFEESGLGDIEGQLRYRWRRETETSPEVFSYFEAVLPHNKSKPLIGTQDLELKLGVGMIKGFSFGTMTLRASLEKTDAVEAGEYAIEYLKRLSDRYRFYTGIEGVQDEVEWITELQIRLGRRATLKLNNGVGITSKATDWAPEVGILFSF